jgi:hypothetical protein
VDFASLGSAFLHCKFVQNTPAHDNTSMIRKKLFQYFENMQWMIIGDIYFSFGFHQTLLSRVIDSSQRKGMIYNLHLCEITAE